MIFFKNGCCLSGLRIVRKNRRIAKIASLKEIEDHMANPLIFHRLIPVLSLRTFATSSRGLKKDYPWSGDLSKNNLAGLTTIGFISLQVT
jgi:hypothetical protein